MVFARRLPYFKRILLCEEFEPRVCLSTVAFALHDIEAGGHSGAASVYAADLDGDRDLDVLSVSGGDDKVGWYENTDGRGSFGEEQVITRAADGAHSVYAADIDGDSDLDVLSASQRDDKIAWYENTDGTGSFGQQTIITTQTDLPKSVFAADVDGDGDIDVLSASFYDGKIAWYENSDGGGSFGDQRVITTNALGAWSVYATDLDGDGDVDVLSASSVQNEIAWYENIDGKGEFGQPQVITTEAHSTPSVYATDIDGDGDIDVLSGGEEIAWYENIDGEGEFAQGDIIATFSTLTARGGGSAYAADLDADGDMDILSASFRWDRGIVDSKVAWYENLSSGTFAEQQVITTDIVGVSKVYAADLDGDGDADVLSASNNQVAWHENLSPESPILAGDANGDFQFDQLDIVLVLQAAKHLTGEAATFEQGDWNGDGVFDQADIVAALQTGSYLRGPFAMQKGGKGGGKNEGTFGTADFHGQDLESSSPLEGTYNLDQTLSFETMAGDLANGEWLSIAGKPGATLACGHDVFGDILPTNPDSAERVDVAGDRDCENDEVVFKNATWTLRHDFDKEPADRVQFKLRWQNDTGEEHHLRIGWVAGSNERLPEDYGEIVGDDPNVIGDVSLTAAEIVYLADPFRIDATKIVDPKKPPKGNNVEQVTYSHYRLDTDGNTIPDEPEDGVALVDIVTFVP